MTRYINYPVIITSTWDFVHAVPVFAYCPKHPSNKGWGGSLVEERLLNLSNTLGLVPSTEKNQNQNNYPE